MPDTAQPLPPAVTDRLLDQIRAVVGATGLLTEPADPPA